MLTFLFLFLFNSTIRTNAVDPATNQQVRNVTATQPNYRVRYIRKNDIRIDGDVSDKSWAACEAIDSLAAPWDAGASGNAQFRACYDENFFYFSFDVKDSIGGYKDDKSEDAVASGDRVELFLAPDTTMRNYYCLEIAPNGNVLDYQASYHRNFNNSWKMEGAEIVSKITPTGYAVEGKLPVDFLKSIKNPTSSPRGNALRAGVFRARKKSGTDPEAFIWYSWINPHVSSPDFHVPSALGTFEFQN